MNTTIDPQNCQCHFLAPKTHDEVRRLLRESRERLDRAQIASDSARTLHWEGAAGEYYRETLRVLYYDAMRAGLSLDVVRQLAWR
ncbi:hypothetical protein [Bifidobacterium avesanii]|uniref:Uncharacterized protein n=1 Tax=Bifidobacterium avesanii TaxID=1798157 RepID=A0A7K3TEV8_9BIFI|nr:hypothetical protein [Bifidobacterium avesanii]NEG77627.1 hypothetical protein [Bifidobacterium avesanii]